jgi:hypothetical protein
MLSISFDFKLKNFNKLSRLIEYVFHNKKRMLLTPILRRYSIS